MKKGKNESGNVSIDNIILNADQNIDFDIVAPYYMDLKIKKK